MKWSQYDIGSLVFRCDAFGSLPVPEDGVFAATTRRGNPEHSVSGTDPKCNYWRSRKANSNWHGKYGKAVVSYVSKWIFGKQQE